MRFLVPWLDTLLWIVGLLYVGGPILIYLTLRLRAYSRYEPVEFVTLPSHVQQYFAAQAPALAQEGFVVAGYIHHTGGTAGVQMYLAIWVNASRGHTASPTAVVPDFGKTKTMLTFTTVVSPRGPTVSTTNYRADAGIFEQRDWLDNARLPWVTDPRELYQVHLNREARLVPPDAVRFIPTPEQVPDALAEGTAHEIREQVRAGTLRDTAKPGEARPTVWGAFLFAVRLLPPIKQVRMHQARRRSRTDYDESRHAPAPRIESRRITHEFPYSSGNERFPLNYG